MKGPTGAPPSPAIKPSDSDATTISLQGPTL
jgi:hypothetical protein